MIIQSVFDLAELCAQKNVSAVLLSPGSRVAPLTLAFVRHPRIQTFTINDERSAAFLALGMAQQKLCDFLTKKKTLLELIGLACTSGTAASNYLPAVTEAFYQQIPLLVFTADRPPEWIDQQDGQTIRQRQLFAPHIKESYELPVDYQHLDANWYFNRILNEAINLAQTYPYGPVHINVPLREPFYPEAGEKVHFPEKIRIIRRLQGEKTLPKEEWNEMMNTWEMSEKKLIVAGQGFPDPLLLRSLTNLHKEYKIPVLGDKIANLHPLTEKIGHHDIFLPYLSDELKKELQPDLLVTFGKSVISKSLKLFLRKYPPHQHWHLQTAGKVADTFQSLTHILPLEPAVFFEKLFNDLDFMNFHSDEEGEENEYHRLWQKLNRQAAKQLYTFFSKTDFRQLYAGNFPEKAADSFIPESEMEIVGEVLSCLPENGLLHLANSMPVRYVNYFDLLPNVGLVFANRGTSGIDGCVGTAVGAALASPTQTVTLITGDIAFFYDRNSLWHNYPLPNLRIILLNNHGGNIFRLIDGPSNQPELEEYFETHQTLIAARVAEDFQMEYFHTNSLAELKVILSDFFGESPSARLLEIETNKIWNGVVFREFKKWALSQHFPS